MHTNAARSEKRNLFMNYDFYGLSVSAKILDFDELELRAEILMQSNSYFLCIEACVFNPLNAIEVINVCSLGHIGKVLKSQWKGAHLLSDCKVKTFQRTERSSKTDIEIKRRA